MANKEKMWALGMHLSININQRQSKIPFRENFDDTFWDYIVEESAKAGMNTIFMEVDDGVEYGSHPEIAAEGAWTRRKVRKEIARCRDLGIKIIPNLNFSACHAFWQKEYRRKTSTIEYYQLCNDLIKETYELFEHPEYIHIGMDEETARHAAGAEFAMFRQKDLYWHDLRFLIDCVADTGAKPWIWSCPLFRQTEGYQAHIDPEEALISPWQYHAAPYKEHWTRIDSEEQYVKYYSKPPYKELNLTYVEEDPYFDMFREKALPLLKDGYEYVPCMSTFYKNPHNTNDMFRYFAENAPDEQIRGYITAPCTASIWKNKEYIDESLKQFKAAREKYYG